MRCLKYSETSQRLALVGSNGGNGSNGGKGGNGSNGGKGGNGSNGGKGCNGGAVILLRRRS